MLTTPERLRSLERLECLVRRLPAVGHALINQLDAQASEEELGGTLCCALANRLRITKPDAALRIADAADLGPRRALTGEPLAPQLTATATAQRQGLIGEAHIKVIRATPQQATAGGVKAAVVVEAVGHPAALHTAIGLTAPGGRTITVGLPPPDVRISLSPLDFVTEGRSLIGSYLGSAVPSHDIPRFVSLWQSGRLPVESLVTSTIRLDDINEAMDHLADGIAVRQLISFTGDL